VRSIVQSFVQALTSFDCLFLGWCRSFWFRAFLQPQVKDPGGRRRRGRGHPDQQQPSGVNVIKKFPSSLTMRPNKLEHLSLKTLSSHVLEFDGKARAKPNWSTFQMLPSWVSSRCFQQMLD
jgi:hypothetical protein